MNHGALIWVGLPTLQLAPKSLCSLGPNITGPIEIIQLLNPNFKKEV